MVFMPPRHGKSELISKWFPSWYIGQFPHHRVILATYSDGFAEGWGRKSRDILVEYGSAFNVELNPDVQRQSEWETVAGGGMVTAGFGGSLMGRGADLIIIDDPFKNAEEALSPTNREKVWDFWQSSLFQRLQPGGIIVMLMTRWHKSDLAGRALAESGLPWEVVSLPALAEDNDILGRQPGQALWPSHYDEKALLQRKQVAGSYFWSALFQQSPVAVGNTLFRAEWEGSYQAAHGIYALKRPGEEGARLFPASRCMHFGTMDLAVSTKQTADYTVLASWAVTPERDLVLLDIDRRRLEAPDQPAMMRQAMEKWNLKFIGVESTAYQLSLVQTARRSGIPVKAIRADTDKLSRAITASAVQEGGQLFFPEWGHWLPKYREELYDFPSGEHDDQVDATTYAAIYSRQRALQGSA